MASVVRLFEYIILRVNEPINRKPACTGHAPLGDTTTTTRSRIWVGWRTIAIHTESVSLSIQPSCTDGAIHEDCIRLCVRFVRLPTPGSFRLASCISKGMFIYISILMFFSHLELFVAFGFHQIEGVSCNLLLFLSRRLQTRGISLKVMKARKTKLLVLKKEMEYTLALRRYSPQNINF